MNSTTNIFSLNVNRLRDSGQHKNIFTWLKGLEADLFLLQDVQYEDEDERVE